MSDRSRRVRNPPRPYWLCGQHAEEVAAAVATPTAAARRVRSRSPSPRRQRPRQQQEGRRGRSRTRTASRRSPTPSPDRSPTRSPTRTPSPGFYPSSSPARVTLTQLAAAAEATERESTPPAAANPTNTPANGSSLNQVGINASTKQLHAFFRQWMERNLPKVPAPGSFSYRAEVRSGLSYPYKQVDNVVYPLEHRRNGLMEDLFRINWFCSERFRGSKVYVIRVNPAPTSMQTACWQTHP